MTTEFPLNINRMTDKKYLYISASKRVLTNGDSFHRHMQRRHPAHKMPVGYGFESGAF